MKASLVLRVLCAVSVAFVLLSAVPPTASQQSPETDIPPRMRYLMSLRERRISGLTAQTLSALQPQMPDDLGAWSKITYDAWQGDNIEIFLMNGDLSNIQQVTNTSTVYESQPRLNRGCTGIAFQYDDGTSDTEIYTMNANGTSRTNRTSNSNYEWFPYWNPAGDRIVYQSYNGVQTDVYRMNSDGSNKVNLSNNSAWDGMPAYSPDGTRIVFASNRGGNDCLLTMDVNGNNQTPLICQELIEDPVYSPDGSQIAYDADSNFDGYTELWVMNNNGSNAHMLFDPPESQTDAWAASWSPDGRYIAFTRATWAYDGQDWYVSTAYAQAWDNNTSSTSFLVSIGYAYDFEPDWHSCDIAAPTSSVAALPATSSATFTVSWTGTDPGNSGILNYDVQVRDGSGGTWTDWQLATTATSALYTGMGGHTYYFRSRGRDNAGNLEAYPSGSDTQTMVENQAPQTAVSALPAWSPGTFTVNWGGSDPGGSGILNYDVQVRDGTSAWMDWQLASTVTSAPYTGVNGHTYSFRSRGRDAAGNLETYPATPDASTVVDAQAPTTAVSALPAFSLETFTVSWTGSDPGGSGITSYDVQVRDGAGGWTDWQLATAAIFAPYTGVTGHTYSFRSRGHDLMGNVEDYPSVIDASTSVDTQPPFTAVEELAPFTRLSASVQWSGFDPGGSGIASYDVQTRDGPSGAWTDWQLAISATGAAFNGTPGHTFYFRSRGRDSLGSLEAYDDDAGDSSTTFYAWAARGTVMDNSGVPVGGATVSGVPGVFSAEPSDLGGDYALYSSVTPVDPLQVQLAKSGYGALPAARIDGSDDVELDAILPPVDNVLVNPGFESGVFAPGWTSGGVLPPTVGSLGHTGLYGAVLGIGNVTPGAPGEPVYTFITQTLPLPSGMTTPFLSFFYQLDGALALENTGLRVRVQRGTIIEDLLETTSDTDGWQPAFYDLGDWQGEAITLTFRVRNVAGITGALALVDEVNIGSASPDLWVAAHSDTGSALPGETVVSQIIYGNQGGAPTSSTLITYTLPVELEFVSASVTPVLTPSGLVWNLPGLPPNSGPFEIEITNTVANTATLFNLYESQARIGIAAHELESLNNLSLFKLQVGRFILLPVVLKQ